MTREVILDNKINISDDMEYRYIIISSKTLITKKNYNTLLRKFVKNNEEITKYKINYINRYHSLTSFREKPFEEYEEVIVPKNITESRYNDLINHKFIERGFNPPELETYVEFDNDNIYRWYIDNITDRKFFNVPNMSSSFKDINLEEGTAYIAGLSKDAGSSDTDNLRLKIVLVEKNYYRYIKLRVADLGLDSNYRNTLYNPNNKSEIEYMVNNSYGYTIHKADLINTTAFRIDSIFNIKPLHGNKFKNFEELVSIVGPEIIKLKAKKRFVNSEVKEKISDWAKPENVYGTSEKLYLIDAMVKK